MKECRSHSRLETSDWDSFVVCMGVSRDLVFLMFRQFMNKYVKDW